MAILFIHGFGGCGGVWYWQAEHFSRSGKVICPDLPGHGVRPWNGEDLAAMAAIMVREVRAAGEETVDIVASSFGGLVALKVWELVPALVRRLVFAGSLPRFTATDGFPAGLSPTRIRKLAGQIEEDLALAMEMFLRSLFTLKERKGVQYVKLRKLFQTLPLAKREALLAILGMLEHEDKREILGRVDKPVLFLFGDNDPICPTVAAEALRKLCPSAQMEAFRSAGHFFFLSAPEVFNGRVERFLA